jgi:ABC-type antimicrobial peptide transport system permease subunit
MADTGFSIIVGGFGIANIMFVSVGKNKYDRYPESLGAKLHLSSSSSLQESVLLSL